MNNTPAWIEHLFKRGSAGHALHTAFLLNGTNEFIAKTVDAQPDGREQLRQASLRELSSRQAPAVALALVFLGTVGSPADLPQIEPFVCHRYDLVRRAARACRFKLQQASRANGGG